jgi:tetrapyrrole methylase family protein/MazG family protein
MSDSRLPGDKATALPAAPSARRGPPEHPDPFRRLVAIMDRLRAPDGCPWDRKQTHQTLRQYLLEETHELMEAIEQSDDKKLSEELGDVLLQVVFHAQLASEEDRFDMDGVCEAICQKLIRRHPHVFGDIHAESPEAALRSWEKIKAAERAAQASPESAEKSSAGERVFSGVPQSLPALLKAARVQEKAACAGFDWPSLGPVLAKIREELGEWEAELTAHSLQDPANPHLPGAQSPAAAPPAEVAEEFGDLLFALVNASRFLGINAEESLQAANRKFMSRYALMTRMAEEEGVDFSKLSLPEMDCYWERAKKAGRSGAK